LEVVVAVQLGMRVRRPPDRVAVVDRVDGHRLGRASDDGAVDPLMKKPKTSLNDVFTYSLYSSEAKTYWNEIVGVVGTKSNSSTAAS